jgi:hypothetical protein
MAVRLDTILEELYEVLSRQARTQEDLLSTAGSMAESIRGRDIEGIQRLTAVYDDQIGAAEMLEEKRLSLCERIGRIVLPGGAASLGEIARKAGSPWTERLLAIRESLKKTMGRLSRLNHSNRIMLEEALHGLGRSMELMFEAPQKQGMYQKGGRFAAGGPRKALLNHKA